MKQVYKFKDWTSAIKMKNELDPCLQIDIGVLKNENDQIDGYQITVFNSFKTPLSIRYKFYIDYGKEGEWCLSTDEAIAFLNQIGFPCQFDKEDIKVNNEVKRILTDLKDLGFTQIKRETRPANVLVFNATRNMWEDLYEITSYNYHDFWFLSFEPMTIDGILNGQTSDVPSV